MQIAGRKKSDTATVSIIYSQRGLTISDCWLCELGAITMVLICGSYPVTTEMKIAIKGPSAAAIWRPKSYS